MPRKRANKTQETALAIKSPMARKPNAGQFKPGNKAASTAQRAKTKDLRSLLAQHVPPAIYALGEIVRTKNHRDRTRAAVAILDRYFGTPIQTITGDLTITHALAEIESRIMAHDPGWIPSAQLPDVRHEETLHVAALPPPAAETGAPDAEPGAAIASGTETAAEPSAATPGNVT